MSDQLATITLLNEEGQRVVFGLSARGWTVNDPRLQFLAEHLSASYPPRKISPADGQPGARLAHAAARDLAGWDGFKDVQVQLPAPQEVPEGSVF